MPYGRVQRSRRRVTQSRYSNRRTRPRVVRRTYRVRRPVVRVRRTRARR